MNESVYIFILVVLNLRLYPTFDIPSSCIKKNYTINIGGSHL